MLGNTELLGYLIRCPELCHTPGAADVTSLKFAVVHLAKKKARPKETDARQINFQKRDTNIDQERDTPGVLSRSEK